MDLPAKTVWDALSATGVEKLYHANSVVTSCQFIKQKALLARGAVERLKLSQTDQCSDDEDKRYSLSFDTVASVDVIRIEPRLIEPEDRVVCFLPPGNEASRARRGSQCALLPRWLGQSQRFEPRAHLSIGVDAELLRTHIVESAGFTQEKTDCVGAKCILGAKLRGDPRIAVARDTLVEIFSAGCPVCEETVAAVLQVACPDL
jgi:hypothetical protein